MLNIFQRFITFKLRYQRSKVKSVSCVRHVREQNTTVTTILWKQMFRISKLCPFGGCVEHSTRWQLSLSSNSPSFGGVACVQTSSKRTLGWGTVRVCFQSRCGGILELQEAFARLQKCQTAGSSCFRKQ